ncbi:MAG: DUF4242 domain-containing protein [Chloroflexi bacterium]|nr:DUF4242 domain-containing protein [Chloroflexota bacterium]
MPVYLDHHAAVQLPPAVVQQLVSEIKAKKKAQDGTVPLNVLAGKNDTFCLTEAPNADVVHKHHEALGIKLDKGQIYEVQTLV